MKIIIKYLKMIFPSFGKFTNGAYTFKGIICFGRLYGKCIETDYDNLISIGEFKNLPQYHLKNSKLPQFKNI